MEIQSYMELDRSQQRGSSTVYFLPATYSYTRHPTIGTQTQEYGVPVWAPWEKNKTTQQPLDEPPLPTGTNHLADPLPTPQTSSSRSPHSKSYP